MNSDLAPLHSDSISSAQSLAIARAAYIQSIYHTIVGYLADRRGQFAAMETDVWEYLCGHTPVAWNDLKEAWGQVLEHHHRHLMVEPANAAAGRSFTGYAWPIVGELDLC